MDEAVECYQQALDIVSSLGVEKGKAEPLFGLCVLYGHHGSLDIALRYGLEGLRVSKQSKDDWMAAINELAIAIAYYKSASYEQAQVWADRARQSFVRCGDSYLSTVAMFWLAMTAAVTGETEDFRRISESLLTRTQANDLDFLFTRPTILGLRDPQEVIPLLLLAEHEGICRPYVTALLADLGSTAGLERHPGYTLRVQALGQFRAWRGLEEIRAKEWQREKAKQLLQYFVTCRKQLIHKEQMVEALWGEAGSDGDFKVAMNALINALEPSRSARTNSFYILKQSSSYGLNLATGIQLDVDEFESYISRGARIAAKDPEQAIRLYRLALNQYKGDFLSECCYEDWCQEERERLLMLYITTAERMAHMLFERGEIEECISLCLRIIGKDSCWEEAYRLLMQCYYRQNNRAMVIRVYRQCRDNLKSELGVSPAKDTNELFKKLAVSDENI
jgi:two-component SAPR family response regulator